MTGFAAHGLRPGLVLGGKFPPSHQGGLDVRFFRPLVVASEKIAILILGINCDKTVLSIDLRRPPF